MELRIRLISTDQFVVLCVRTDPEPNDALSGPDAHSAVTRTDARGPEAADFLQVKRRVTRILLEKFEASIRDTPDGWGKRPIAAPKIRRSVMIQSLVVSPEA